MLKQSLVTQTNRTNQRNETYTFLGNNCSFSVESNITAICPVFQITFGGGRVRQFFNGP